MMKYDEVLVSDDSVSLHFGWFHPDKNHITGKSTSNNQSIGRTNRATAPSPPGTDRATAWHGSGYPAELFPKNDGVLHIR